MSIAKDLELPRIHILSDALKVIEAINGAEDWSIHHRILDIECFVSHFDKVCFSHISRDLNVEAIRLLDLIPCLLRLCVDRSCLVCYYVDIPYLLCWVK